MSEQTKVDASRDEISIILKDVVDIKMKLHEMYVALMGSPLSKDGGLVFRIVNNEVEIEKLNKRIDENVKNETKNALYLKIIWGMGGFVLSAVGIWVISHILK